MTSHSPRGIPLGDSAFVLAGVTILVVQSAGWWWAGSLIGACWIINLIDRFLLQPSRDVAQWNKLADQEAKRCAELRGEKP